MEDEAAIVDTLEQNHARRGLAVAGGGREGHGGRVLGGRLFEGGAARVVEPFLNLPDRVDHS